MKYMLSYIWPVTKRIESEYSGMMEITSVNGTKFLNTKNANYSFGTLQRLLEKGLSKVDLKNVNSVLLLGMGGGSVVFSLRQKFKYKGKIVAVELDKKIIEIARDEFSIMQFDDLIIKNAEAFEFVNQSVDQYDLVIIDLFIDINVPPQFYSMVFIENICRLMSATSSLIFNLGIGEVNRDKRNEVIDFFKSRSKYSVNVSENVEGYNTLMIVHKNVTEKTAKPWRQCGLGI